MATFAFDINGVAAGIITPIAQIAWRRVPVFIMAQPTLYNYILLVEYFDNLGLQRTLEMRLFTDTIAVMVYELANQGTLTEGVDIALCDSMYMRTHKNSNVYNSKAAATINMTNVSSVPDCDANFTGDLVLYTAMPIINNSLPMLTEPAVADTMAITNGVFTNIPILP